MIHSRASQILMMMAVGLLDVFLSSPDTGGPFFAGESLTEEGAWAPLGALPGASAKRPRLGAGAEILLG